MSLNESTKDSSHFSAQESDYRDIFKKIPAGILLFDNKLSVIDMNDQCRIFLGLEPDEVENCSLYALFDKEITRLFENTLRGEYGFYEGKNIKSNTGYFLNIAINVKPYRFGSGLNIVDGGIAVFDDISEQRLAEIAVNMSYDTLQTVLDNIDFMAYVVDASSFKIKYLNRTAAGKFGSGYWSKCFTFFAGNRKKPCTKCPVNVAKNGISGERKTWEFSDNEGRWYKYTSNYINWIDSSKVFLIIAHDITSQKEADLRIKQQNKELESQTRELETAILKVMEQNVLINNQADELMFESKTKDKMFSIIGHDLRGPVGNIKNVIEIVLDEYEFYDKEQIKDFLIPVAETAKSANYLLSNLLYWAKSRSGMMSASPEFLNINELISENISLLSSDLENKNINIRFDSKENFQVYADENMLNTIIRNLLSNALKFSFKNGTISVSCKIKTENRRKMIEITVADNGMGIEKENMSKLFNNKEHFTTSGTNNEKGSGLGLVLCQEFVHMQGGTIRAESEHLKGSRFIFTVPVSGTKKNVKKN